MRQKAVEQVKKAKINIGKRETHLEKKMRKMLKNNF